jgi:hypothetical protein
MKSGNLNFLEPFGPLQAFNGTALPLFYIMKYVVSENSLWFLLLMLLPCLKQLTTATTHQQILDTSHYRTAIQIQLSNKRRASPYNKDCINSCPCKDS